MKINDSQKNKMDDAHVSRHITSVRKDGHPSIYEPYCQQNDDNNNTWNENIFRMYLRSSDFYFIFDGNQRLNRNK